MIELRHLRRQGPRVDSTPLSEIPVLTVFSGVIRIPSVDIPSPGKQFFGTFVLIPHDASLNITSLVHLDSDKGFEVILVTYNKVSSDKITISNLKKYNSFLQVEGEIKD